MTGRYVVKADQSVIVIDDLINDRERQFAAGPGETVNDRYALELAIEMMSKSVRSVELVQKQTSSFFSRIFHRRMTPLAATC